MYLFPLYYSLSWVYVIGICSAIERVVWSAYHEIYIDRITASVTGKGVGQKAFSKITELADVHNVVLILICTPTDLSYSERLTNFYIRNNFSKVSYDLMVRLPTKDRGKKNERLDSFRGFIFSDTWLV